MLHSRDAHWERSSVDLPTNLFSRNEASHTRCKSELNVCLPAVPHPGCEWNPSFKSSLLSRHKRFYTDFTTFQGHRERWGRGITLPERKTNLSSFALWSLSMCQMSPLPTLYILVSGLPRVAGGCQSSCMRDSFLIATFLGLRAPALFLICL